MATEIARVAGRSGGPAVITRRRLDGERGQGDLDGAPIAPPLAARADIAPLQSLVDALAESLGRPVLLDDMDLRLLAHSQQGEHDVDRVRLESILRRQASRKVARHLREVGIDRFTGPAAVAADEELGMRSRLCCPVRWSGALLGYLWIVENGEPVRGGELEECGAAAAAVATLLHEEEFLVHSTRRLQGRLLTDLLTGSPAEVERAALEIGRLNLMVPGCGVAVLVAGVRGPAGECVPEAVRAALGAAIDRCSRAVPRRQALACVHEDRGLLALALAGPGDEREHGNVAERLHACLRKSFAQLPQWTPVVGVGEASGGLTEARNSYAQALAAARLAAAMPDNGPVARWGRLGVYRALLSIPVDRISSLADIHEGLALLAETATGDSLIETAETYLDLGADARAAAKVLHLHRSSLYYRLQKCEAVAGLSFRDGGDRLALHLALKLARLSGQL